MGVLQKIIMSFCTGLVKLLRRCLTQMSSRTRSFIETCVKFERGARQQARRNRPHLCKHGLAAPCHGCSTT